jgi:hypothetical protein
VRDQVVRVLRLDPSTPPGGHERLMDLGFDSLMAVQLRNLLSKGVGLERPLPASLMFDYPTIEALSANLLERIVPAVAAPDTRDAPAAPSAAPPVLGKVAVAAMSEAEIEALLLDRLAKS